MPWNGQGGGGGGGPWGNGPGPWARGPNGGNAPQSPNLDEILRRGQEWLRRFLPGGGAGPGGIVGIIVGVLVAIWAVTGLYRVLPDEQGIVLRFGAYEKTTQPGLNYHLPYPIETVFTPKVTRVNRTEIGLRTGGEGPAVARGPGTRDVPEEALMLTGDENIVDINFTVFWVIKDPKAYLFNIAAPEATVKAAAESAMRETVGRTPIASALAEGRRAIEVDTQKLLQYVLDSYGSGVEVTQVQLQKVDPPGPVIDAFRDVQRARTDQERARNEAEGYRNDILPRARGEAERITQEAEAYKQEIVARAQGDAQRFLSVLQTYKAAKDVTTERLYLETMEQILRSANKVLIDPAAQGAGQGVVPYLPLPDLTRRTTPPPAPANQANQSPSVPSLSPAGASTGGTTP
ncbi:MAG TPA: FtsH protease activity modulator HflK [Stellaceae bacterium]|nr:FtsH protease activity modulator HflK [Stellaceae bacterium]